MAQQASSSQREPSMDEILASIRRIIEESEPDRAGVDLSAIEQLAAGPGPAANDPESGLRMAKAVEPVTTRPVEPSAPAAKSTEAYVDLDSEALSPSFDADAFAIDRDLESAFRQMEDVSVTQVERREAPKVELDATPQQPPRETIADVVAQAAPPTLSERAQTIISEQTGRQVAASFGNLAEVFAANRQRSLDEVAEEMMRPMLQDWMDNNLPTLVERLVREEIERVARGS